ncbi:MAG: type II toxin-antitoxin system HicB family antitoxin [Deltaproteobacteria bacterium]|nr:type II toxin-antitoxin system HicB family antitoxin [Deltaproteobacteria bacterium]
MKKLATYKSFHYRMEIEYDQNDRVYFVSFPDLPGCVMHAETLEEAVKAAHEVKDEWLTTAYEKGWKIPEPSRHQETTGRLTLRVPRYIHKKIMETAEKEGVSQNQLLLSFISEKLAYR